MPQATPMYSINPVVTLQLAANGMPPVPSTNRSWPSYQEAILHEACRAASIAHAAMTSLSLSVAEVLPGDPRHAAVVSAVALLRSQWGDEVKQVWSIPAAGLSGLRDKAGLLDSLIDRDTDGSVPGSPVLALAASLAADVLQLSAAMSA